MRDARYAAKFDEAARHFAALHGPHGVEVRTQSLDCNFSFGVGIQFPDGRRAGAKLQRNRRCGRDRPERDAYDAVMLLLARWRRA